MDSPTAPAHRGCIPWQGLLLAVSLLNFWSPPAAAQPRVESVPPDVAEGKDVLLRVHNLPGNIRAHHWYKGENVDNNREIISYLTESENISHGPLYSGREIIYPNGSLLFQKVALNYTGNYTLQATDNSFRHTQVTGQFRVHPRTDDPTPQSPGLSDGAIAGIVIGVLAGLALIAALVYFLYIRRTGGASDQRDLTEHKPSASNHSQGHSDNSPNKVPEVTYSSLNFNGQESKKPTSASLSPTATETVYSELKKK